MNHIASLCEDGSLRSPDTERLNVIITKWTQARIILSCVHYIDILDLAASLNLFVQLRNDVDIVMAIQSVFKGHRAME